MPTPPARRRPSALPSSAPDDLVRELGRLVGELVAENRRLRRDVERLSAQRKDMSEPVERALKAIKSRAEAALGPRAAGRRTARSQRAAKP